MFLPVLGRAVRALTVVAVLLIPAVVAGQSVAVRVTSRPNGGALGGALVSLQDLGGKRIVQALADERGRAELTAPASGRYRLRVDAIGYQGVLGDPMDLAAGAVVERAVGLEAAPLNLNELVVASSRPVQCDLEEAGGTAAARLWEEARKALTGTQLTGNRPTDLEVRTFERRLDVRGRIVSETGDTRRAPTSRPFAAIDPDSLGRLGYVQERPDGLWYHGPDADLLLSERFLDDHCFRPAALGSDSASRVGLEFQPTPSRRVPDISGVLWLDAKTLELRDLTFAYTGFEWPRGAVGLGGQIAFARLANGGWIVAKWTIRMPVTQRRMLRVGQRDSLIGYREAGGSAATLTGANTGTGPTAVTGTIFDSLANRPLAGAIVSVQEGAFADTTDEAGRFRIVSPGTGDYLLSVDHPRFRLFGLEPLRGAARFRRGKTDTTHLATPGLAATLRRLCGVDRIDSTAALLVGLVTDSLSGRPLDGAVVTIRSDTKTVERTGRIVTVREKGTEWDIQPGPGGTFHSCGIPRQRALEVQSDVPGRSRVRARLEPDTTTIRELLIRHPE